MKKNLLLSLCLFYPTLGINTVHAQALQTPALSAAPAEVPYPPVLSPALDTLPVDVTTIVVGDETFYYSNGVFYQKIVLDNKYTAVPPPIGAVVVSIPAGYEYMMVGDDQYYVYGNVYYKRVLEGFKVVAPVII